MLPNQILKINFYIKYIDDLDIIWGTILKVDTEKSKPGNQKVMWKHHQLCLNVKFVLIPKGNNRNNTSFV